MITPSPPGGQQTKPAVLSSLKPPIHDATCNMQLAACNRIASCVLEMLRVACSVILLQTNRIVVYSLQHVALSFKGFTGNVTTEHLSRRGDYSETQRFYGLASVSTKIAAFSWKVTKIDVLQVRRRRSCRYGEQRTIFIPVRHRPTTSLRPAIPARHACPPSHARVVQFVYCYTSPARVIASCVCSTYVINITTNIPTLITLQLISRETLLQCGACKR